MWLRRTYLSSTLMRMLLTLFTVYLDNVVMSAFIVGRVLQMVSKSLALSWINLITHLCCENNLVSDPSFLHLFAHSFFGAFILAKAGQDYYRGICRIYLLGVRAVDEVSSCFIVCIKKLKWSFLIHRPPTELCPFRLADIAAPSCIERFVRQRVGLVLSSDQEEFSVQEGEPRETRFRDNSKQNYEAMGRLSAVLRTGELLPDFADRCFSSVTTHPSPCVLLIHRLCSTWVFLVLSRSVYKL